LGTFGCGVFKALANNNIKIDIVSGTSIGAVNAAIIAGSKGDHPEKELEQFWLELADGDSRLSFPFVDRFAKYPNPVPTRISQTKSKLSFYRSAFHGM
jgi:predicted acylesterase/phospholipase RssA